MQGLEDEDNPRNIGYYQIYQDQFFREVFLSKG